MITPDLVQFIVNGSAQAILGVAVIILWNRGLAIEKKILNNARRIGELEADLRNCLEDHLSDRETITQRDATIQSLQQAADERNRFNRK